MRMSRLVSLHHISGFRSTRAYWLYLELQQQYGAALPELKLVQHNPDTFRTVKPPGFLELNPNGKVLQCIFELQVRNVVTGV